MVALSDPLLVQLAERLASRDVSALEPLGRRIKPDLCGQVCRPAGGRQRGTARSSANRTPRRVAASPGHPGARCDAAGVGAGNGLPRRVGTRSAATGWFQALACFKSAATWSLIVKHYRRRNPPDLDLEVMAAALPQLLSRAGDLLG